MYQRRFKWGEFMVLLGMGNKIDFVGELEHIGMGT